MLRLSKAIRATANAHLARAADLRIISRLSAIQPKAFEGMDETMALARVAEARDAATSFGIQDLSRRMLFIELACTLAPQFWLYAPARGLLNASTGTPDIRFGDVCASMKAALHMAGRGDDVWWD